MRYSSALVLSTIVVGQAAAANLHNRHASFHARRQAEAKRSADLSDVDWSKVAYDLSDVDWSKVNYGKSSADSQPAQDSQPQAAEAKPAEAPKEPAPAPPAPDNKTPAQPVAPTSTKIPSKDPIGDLADSINDRVHDALNGLQSMVTNLGAKVGKNHKTNQEGIWLGKESPWRVHFTNDNSKDTVLFCWKSNDFKNMCINEMQPLISVGLKSGQSIDVSFEENASAACAPVFPGTKLGNFGGVYNTWFEVTFGKTGAFDISRNVNMNGTPISAKGSKCTSDMETCVFKCKSGDSCETNYELCNCDASNGGGGGYDPIMGGTGGGCAMGQNGEVIQVVLS